jgi:hypothetical protein
MQGFRQSDYMAVSMADEDKIEVEKRSLIGKVGATFLKFINWLAKAQEANPPCAG